MERVREGEREREGGKEGGNRGMRLINVDRRKLARGPKSKQPHEPHSARYVSHFHASGNCRSQLIRYSKECFIKAFINAVLFLLTPLTFATENCLDPPEKAARTDANARTRTAAEKLRNSTGPV